MHQIDSLFLERICFFHWFYCVILPGTFGVCRGTDSASVTLWLWWQMLHVGNYSWQLFSKGPGIVNILACMGRSRVALCALLGHSCGEWGGEPLQPLISGCSPLRKNNNKLLACCLYGTWLLCVLISGLATVAALTHALKNTVAVASGDGFDSELFSSLFLSTSLRGKCVSHKETCENSDPQLFEITYGWPTIDCCFNCLYVFSSYLMLWFGLITCQNWSKEQPHQLLKITSLNASCYSHFSLSGIMTALQIH